MDIYASDDEKGEEIKQWWRDNGRSVIVGCVLGIVVIFSGRYWLNYQQNQAESASFGYQNVVVQLAEDNVEQASMTTQALFDNYASTPYAVFAALEMATQSVEDGDAQTAESYLRWVISNAELSAHQEIARLRLGQLLLSANQYEQALTMVNESTSTAFSSLFAELRGDVLMAQGNKLDAKMAYQTAIVGLAQGSARQILLQVKLNDLATTNES